MDNGLQTITVGLFWHSPNSANLGVGALSLSNISIIREAAEKANLKPVFKIFGFVDDREIYVSGDDISVFALNGKYVFLPWSNIDKDISQCDLILDIGGGDSFTDIYGLKRFLFLIISKMRVLRAKVPLILSPQTIGPFKHWYTRIVAGWITKKATMTFARDQVSHDYAVNKLGVIGNKIHVTTDVAFALPYTKPSSKGTPETNVGINVSGLLFNGGYTGKNEFGLNLDYPNLIRKIIAFFIKEKCNVHLMAHVICDDFAIEDDLAVCEALAEEFPEVKVAPSFADPIEAKTAIAKMDLFMGARMHACIAAISSGVPVIPMAYSRKFGGLFGALGYNHTLDCLSSTTDEAFEHIKESYYNRDQLQLDTDTVNKLTEAKVEVYKEKLLQLIMKKKQDA